MTNKVEFLIKSNGSFVAMDVSDFPYRLNRTAFSTSSDKLKTLGGTTSTQVKFDKSKKNNLTFVGKSDFKSVGKFNSFQKFEAMILDNGSLSGLGVFELEGTTHKEYYGTFYDNDATWINDLANIRLNELGYVDGVPTWLVPFDGTASINEVNELSNRETDFCCPLIQYNNTPILDYLDLTNEQIFELDKRFPQDFEVKNGFFGNRLGLNYNDFLPSPYYRNVLERIAAQLGLTFECPLFYTPEFNALYMPYVGSREYQFNWKNIASVYSENPFAQQVQESEIDLLQNVQSTINPADGLALNKLGLIPLGNDSDYYLWIRNEIFKFKQAQIIKHDDWDNTLIEKISLVNNFNTFNQYLVPTDGNYTIEVNSQIRSRFDDPIDVFDPAPPDPSPVPYWIGMSIIFAFGTWDVNSQADFNALLGNRWGANRYQNHFGADDNVLIVLRRNASDGFNYTQTEQRLYEWMNGQNTEFTDSENDVIAYFSPKRYKVSQDFGGVAANQISGSPISNFTKNVEILDSDHAFAAEDFTPTADYAASESKAHIKINCDLKKGERVEIFWISLANVYGEGDPTPTEGGVDPIDRSALEATGVKQYFGTEAYEPEFLAEYSISYNCGQYDLDLAANLPNITAKDFIASFINQFNLHFFRQGNTIQFTPIAQYYSPERYNITSRVDWKKGWESKPIEVPKIWIVGYNVDGKDKLLSESFDLCTGQSKKSASSYGNVVVENQNSYAKGEAMDLVLFSSTKFIDASCVLTHRVADAIFLPTETDPVSGFVLQTGLLMPILVVPKRLNGLKVPSIQSLESANTKLFGELNRNFDYTPRLLYHLGTANQYYGFNEEYQILVGYPRAICDGAANPAFIRKQKHWVRATVSQFDLENSVQTGIEYPTLRFDTANGLYSRFFENLVELYNNSEQFTIYASLRPSDWVSLKGYKKVIFQDQLYRLMQIKDYDPVTKEACIVVLLKEV